jgi:hypothetical protein
MACKECGARERRQFAAEIFVHFPGLAQLETRPVLVFPTLLICPHCGWTDFTMPEAELRILMNSNAAGAA